MSMIPFMIAYAAAEQSRQRRHRAESAARRRREEEKRKEEQRKQEEHNRMVKRRKEAPLEYTYESWQKRRCYTAISSEPSVQRVFEGLEEKCNEVIETKVSGYEEEILVFGQEYETVRKELEKLIQQLTELGVRVDGRDYLLKRVSPSGNMVTHPTMEYDEYGIHFATGENVSVKINTDILDSGDYYGKKFEDYGFDSVEANYQQLSKRHSRYQKVGKYLKFILDTDRYYQLDSSYEEAKTKYERGLSKKADSESYSALTKEQLEVIRKYIEQLLRLEKLSRGIENGFYKINNARYGSNHEFYDDAIELLLEDESYSEDVRKAFDLISRIINNDSETMSELYGRVAGQYYGYTLDKENIYEILFKNASRVKESLEARRLKKDINES